MFSETFTWSRNGTVRSGGAKDDCPADFRARDSGCWQEGSVISFGSETGAKELVLVALDSGQSVDVPRKRLEVTRELACCVCHSCLPCEEEAESNPEEADSDLLRCQSCYIPIHQQVT